MLFCSFLGHSCRFCIVVVCGLRLASPRLTSPCAFCSAQVVELEAAEDDLDNIQQEIKMLQAFNCPQLTRYHGSFIVGRYVTVTNGHASNLSR